MERLQKYLARCAVASRRAAEELITSGKISVNGEIITQLGFKVSSKDRVYFDGLEVKPVEKIILVMNKPRYYLSMLKDELKRKTVLDLVPPQYKELGIFPIGRLDYDTKGVLLLTNDGELSNMLIGPRSKIEKEYLVRISGLITKEDLRKLANGLVIDGFRTRKAKSFLVSNDLKNQSSLVKLIIEEGKYHQVKKMFASLGYEVKRLTRTRFANITIDNLAEGEIRDLSIHEQKTLYHLAKTSLQD